MADGAQITEVQRVPVPESQAHISTDTDDRREPTQSPSLAWLKRIAERGGDISNELDSAELTELGVKAVREWEIDEGSRSDWKEKAERSLDIAAQEHGDEDREPIWEDAANIHYPILTTAAQQFAARAYPELVKGDKVVGVKVFDPPPTSPGPLEAARAAVPQPTPQQAPAIGQAVQQAQNAQNQQGAADEAKNARGERVSHYLNYLIFYKMDDWEGETDQLLHTLPIIGSDFKKVYYGTTALCSDYVSSIKLAVHNDTKSIYRCPRLTEGPFNVYPYEIEERTRAGIYRDADLPPAPGNDPEAPREFIEQHRLDDFDGDGLAEPYIVTVDVQTKTVLRVEPAFTADDVITDGEKVIRIDRWLPYAEFAFLPDPKGRFYKLGFGTLLQSITDSIDTLVNQLLDAGTAEIAGGGFIASGVRLQGSGQGGAIYQQPGEYGVVSAPGMDLREAIWERTVPHPSAVSLQLFELLLAAAKDIASVKDVITGEAPSTAPVGTTLALQNQALQVFSSIYKRIYRGFRDEFRLMFRAVKRWATDKDRKEYTELTGGNLDEDFAGDGTDIQPVADPTVVTKMQKVARLQTLMQIAESPLGMAAGMTQAGPAQKIITDMLDDLDYPNPQDYVAPVPPNPLEVAKAQDMQATAQERTAKAQIMAAKLPSEVEKAKAETTRTHAEALRTTAEAAEKTHGLHKEADRIARTGSVADAEQMMNPAEEAEKDRVSAAQEADKDRAAAAQSKENAE